MTRLYRFLLGPLALALNCWQLSLLNRWQRRRLHRRIQRQIGRLRWLELSTGLRVTAMAQKFVELSSSTTTDRLQNVGAATCHLSDGTCVMLEYDGTSVYLKHTGSGHGTAAAIATLSGFYIPALNLPGIEVARDSLDNLYVIGQDSTITHPAVRCQAFTKGAGYSWTAQTALVGANIGSQNNTRITETHAVWSNTTGGTNSKGHLMVIGCVQGATTQSFYSILDAGAALNGSGTLVKNQAYAPNFLTTPPNTSGFQMDLSADGFGASSGLAISMVTSTQVGVGNWAISSAGALTTNVWRGALFPGTMSATTKIRIVRYGANAWAIAMPSTTAGRYMIARYSATAQLTAPTDSGAPASMPLNGANLGWDLFVDPVTATKVWVIAVAAVAGGQQQVYRLGCAVGAGVVWDAATTTDDLLTNTNTTQSNLRVVKEPVSALVDWQAFVQTAVGNYALDADYTNFGSAPNAPTLTAPGNGAYVDVSGGVTLTATYNSTDGANQSAVAVRLKVGAGAYNYWRASDSTWQAAIQWIPVSTAPGASFSVTVTGLSNGNADNWSMASQEASASLQGPFATDFVLNAQAAPTVVVNAPTGVQVISKPTISWTPTLAGGTSQTAYRAVVYNAAQYGAGGFTPGSGPSVWDSGVVASAATSVVIGNMLSVGTFRAYVQITETGAETSAWAYSGFTTLFTPPAQPALTGSYDGTNGRAVVNVQGRDNLLSENQASLETDTTGWTANTNCAIAQSATFALDGSSSLRLTATAGGTMNARTPTGASGVAVLPSTQYTVLASFRAGSTLRFCWVIVNWYQASGAASAVRGADSFGGNDAVGAWTQQAGTITSPSDAAFAAILVQIDSAGASEIHYVDEIGLAPGASSVWAKGGLTPGTLALVEYSDDGGATWATVRGAAAVTIPTPSELATVYDYEAPPLKTRNYRATITGAGLASAPSALLPLANTGSAAFWLKDPTDPTGNVAIWLPKEKYPAQRFAERLQSFPTLGRANPIVLADAAPAMTRPGTIDVRVKNDADFATLVGTITRQKVLLLQLHEQWYVRITDRAIAGPDLGNRRDVSLAYVQVDAP